MRSTKPKHCSSTVAIIIDPQFADRLEVVARRQCAWMVESEANRAAVERIRQKHLAYALTTFFSDPNSSPSEVLIKILPVVNEHHGVLSCSPPYKVLSIHGVRPTRATEAALRAIDFELSAVLDDGFVARRIGKRVRRSRGLAVAD